MFDSHHLSNLPLVLAQDDLPPPPPSQQQPAPEAPVPGAPQSQQPGQPLQQQQPQRPPGLFDGPFFLILLGILVLMFFFSIRSQSKERKRRQAMLGALKKGDRVQTVGGMLGVVTDLRDDEVTLKVDEGANVKLRFARSAIQTVVESKGQD